MVGISLHQITIQSPSGTRPLRWRAPGTTLETHDRASQTVTEPLRDLTAHTSLIAALYQSDHDAWQSCADHVEIVDALEAGDLELARTRMLEHIGNVESALKSTARPNASNRLHAVLQVPETPSAPSDEPPDAAEALETGSGA